MGDYLTNSNAVFTGSGKVILSANNRYNFPFGANEVSTNANYALLYVANTVSAATTFGTIYGNSNCMNF